MIVESRRQVPTPERPELRLVVTGRSRIVGRLDLALEDPPEDPSLDEVLALARAAGPAEAWSITGGEPTLRADLPKLVRELVALGGAPVGLVTDGLALAQDEVPARLAALGLHRVDLHLNGGRADAHDWLVGQPGAFKRVVKALRGCVAAGLDVGVICTVTRPTGPYLEEAVDLFARLGARAVTLRRPVARGPMAGQDITVAPRLALVSKELERAAAVAARSGLHVRVEGFPACTAPGLRPHQLAVGAVRWALPPQGRWPFLQPRFEPPAHERGCATCPGGTACAGAPTDYTLRFGRAEIDSEGSKVVNPGTLPATPLAGGEVYPPPRAGRAPPTRPAYARLAARLPSLSGDPLVAQSKGAVPDSLRVVFLAPSKITDPVLGDAPQPVEPEPTRGIRIRLVRAAQHGAHTLRIASAGSLWHPEIGELLRETTRLQMGRVEVAGDVSGLDRLTDMELRRLRGIARIDGALFSTDPTEHDAIAGHAGAFEATLRVLDRLGSLVPSLSVGVYAVLRGHEGVAAFVDAWEQGELPGSPRFRLAPGGGSLSALARAAEALPEGEARRALAAVLPVSLLARDGAVVPAPQAEVAWGEIPEVHARPSGIDVHGCYTGRLDRKLGPGDDPGFAVGWSIDA